MRKTAFHEERTLRVLNLGADNLPKKNAREAAQEARVRVLLPDGRQVLELFSETERNQATLRRKVHKQPFCVLCGAPLCLGRAVLAGETLVCGACFDENPNWRENPGSRVVLDGRKLFERKAKGGK